MFPVIRHIDDVLPHIEGRDEFVIAERNHFKIVNYVVQKNDTFLHDDPLTASIRRELRGIAFNNDGVVISRPVHKFFNLNEKEETQHHVIDFSKKHRVFAKLDGSMIRPIPVEMGFRFATKMGITDIALKAENFAHQDERYFNFCEEIMKNGFTPSFEFISPDNRIVIKYSETDLPVLLARHNMTGEYMNHDDLEYLAKNYGINTVESYENVTDILSFMNEVRDAEGIEGYVVRFDDGFTIKVKSLEYVGLHKSREVAENARHIVAAVLNDTVDDLKSMLFDDDLKKVIDIESKVWEYVEEQEKALKIKYDAVRLVFEDKKSFALGTSDIEKHYKPMIFKMWDGYSSKELIVSWMLTKCGQDKIFYESFGDIFG